MIETAQEFFRIVVMENYNDCRNRAADVRLAMNFAVSVLALADWTFADYSTLGADRVAGSRRAYLRMMRARSDEYDLVCDLADAWKHTRNSRVSARISTAQQVQSDHFRAGDPVGLPLIMLTAFPNAADRTPLEPLFGRVLQLWAQELHDLDALAPERRPG